MRTFFSNQDQWDQQLDSWQDSTLPHVPPNHIHSKPARRIRAPLVAIENLPKKTRPQQLSSLTLLKCKIRQMEQEPERWEYPVPFEKPSFSHKTRSGLIKVRTQSGSWEKLSEEEEKKRPRSCREVVVHNRGLETDKLYQSFSSVGAKAPSIHSRRRSRSQSQRKCKARLTINQLEQHKVDRILQCLGRQK